MATLESIDNKLASMETKLETYGSDIKILFKTIEGNGQPGLKQDMATMKAEHAICAREREQGPARQGNIIQLLMLIAVFVCCGLTIWLGR